MADLKGNPALARQKCRMNIAKLNAQIENQLYDNLQMEERKNSNIENIENTKLAIKREEELQAELEAG